MDTRFDNLSGQIEDVGQQMTELAYRNQVNLQLHSEWTG